MTAAAEPKTRAFCCPGCNSIIEVPPGTPQDQPLPCDGCGAHVYSPYPPEEPAAPYAANPWQPQPAEPEQEPPASRAPWEPWTQHGSHLASPFAEGREEPVPVPAEPFADSVAPVAEAPLNVFPYSALASDPEPAVEVPESPSVEPAAEAPATAADTSAPHGDLAPAQAPAAPVSPFAQAAVAAAPWDRPPPAAPESQATAPHLQPQAEAPPEPEPHPEGDPPDAAPKSVFLAETPEPSAETQKPGKKKVAAFKPKSLAATAKNAKLAKRKLRRFVPMLSVACFVLGLGALGYAGYELGYFSPVKRQAKADRLASDSLFRFFSARTPAERIGLVIDADTEAQARMASYSSPAGAPPLSAAAFHPVDPSIVGLSHELGGILPPKRQISVWAASDSAGRTSVIAPIAIVRGKALLDWDTLVQTRDGRLGRFVGNPKADPEIFRVIISPSGKEPQESGPAQTGTVEVRGLVDTAPRFSSRLSTRCSADVAAGIARGPRFATVEIGWIFRDGKPSGLEIKRLICWGLDGLAQNSEG